MSNGTLLTCIKYCYCWLQRKMTTPVLLNALNKILKAISQVADEIIIREPVGMNGMIIAGNVSTATLTNTTFSLPDGSVQFANVIPLNDGFLQFHVSSLYYDFQWRKL